MSNTTSLVRALEGAVDKFEGDVKGVLHKVDTVVADIGDTTLQIKNNIEDFKNVMKSGEELALAHEQILTIEQKINSKLEQYQDIRKTVLGVVKDCDINLVRGETIQELSERLWMNNSRYWLAYALIALSAWVNDKKDIADNAIAEAMRKESVKSSLFFCLLALRFGRSETAFKWLEKYFSCVDPATPPRETSLLLQAYLYGAFGRDKLIEGKVRVTVEGWVKQLETDKQISRELSESFYKNIQQMPVESSFNSDTLKTYATNYATLQKSMDNTSKFSVIYNQLETIKNNEAQRPKENFIASLDKLLEGIVSDFDEEELKLKNEREYYRLIMLNKGDKDKAKEQYKEFKKTTNDDANIGRQMVNWALYDNDATSGHIKRFALQKTKDWYIEAVESYGAQLKVERPAYAELEIDLWKGSTNGRDRDEVVEDMKRKFNTKKLELYVFNKLNISLIVIAIVAAFICGGIALGAELPLAWCGLAISGALIITMIVTICVGLKGFPGRVERAKKTLYACIEATEKYYALFDEFAQKEDSLKNMLYYY